MRHHFFDYLKIEDWEIISQKICHFYNEDATPFTAICVKIGTMTECKTTIDGTRISKKPILHWISMKEYERLIKNSGVVIF